MIRIYPVKKLDARISVPGSKYIANRILLIAALAKGTSTISNVPENDDINNSIFALRKLGVDIQKKDDTLTVRGTGGKIGITESTIDVGQSGTLLRFITGACAISKKKITITGSERIGQRPINELITCLGRLGAKARSRNKGYPPVEISGTLVGGEVEIDGSVSSQFVSSLLLIAPYAKKDITLKIKGELVSKNYVDMTLSVMKQAGASVKREGYSSFTVKAGRAYDKKDWKVPSDPSSASYFMAAAAITRGRIEIDNFDHDSLQGESRFCDVLWKMGCSVQKKKTSITVSCKKSLKGIDLDMRDMPDVVQTLATVSLFCKGKTRIRGISNLKYKESDRINDTAAELRKLGAKVTTTQDEMIITPGKITPALVSAHDDHRMAMSLALAGLNVPGIEIDHPESANKSFPGFWEKLEETGVKLSSEGNIVLIGYRGTGKSTVAAELSRMTGMKALSTDKEIEKKIGKSIKG